MFKFILLFSVALSLNMVLANPHVDQFCGSSIDGDVDLSDHFPPIANQEDTSMCFAYTAADLVSYKLKRYKNSFSSWMSPYSTQIIYNQYEHLKYFKRIKLLRLGYDLNEEGIEARLSQERNKLAQRKFQLSRAKLKETLKAGEDKELEDIEIRLPILAGAAEAILSYSDKVELDEAGNTWRAAYNLSESGINCSTSSPIHKYSAEEFQRKMNIIKEELGRSMLADDFLINSNLQTMIEEVFGKINIDDFNSFLKNPSFDLNPINQLLTLSCEKSQSLTNLDEISTLTKSNFNLVYLDNILQSKRPFGISYNRQVFGSFKYFTLGLDQYADHASTVVGMQGSCFILRNSWGKSDCKETKEALMSHFLKQGEDVVKEQCEGDEKCKLKLFHQRSIFECSDDGYYFFDKNSLFESLDRIYFYQK